MTFLYINFNWKLKKKKTEILWSFSRVLKRYLRNIQETDKKSMHESALLLCQVVPSPLVLTRPRSHGLIRLLSFLYSISRRYDSEENRDLKKKTYREREWQSHSPAHCNNYYVFNTGTKTLAIPTKPPTSCGPLRIHRATNRAGL